MGGTGEPALKRDGSATPEAVARKRILVVDDHRDAARILGLLLESLGHEVQTANDGHNALDAVPKFKPDVVFLDIGLPQLDGYEVARRLRALPDGRGLRLVALTGWGHAEARRNSREAGFDDHLVKPVAAKTLRELLGQG
jgi:CheY-like chemotaxis protein